MVIVRVEVDGCSGDDKMVLQMMHPLSRQVADGCVVDSVWRLTVPKLPHRYVRLNQGRDSLQSLLQKYSFTDGNECSYSLEPDRQIVQNLLHNSRKIGERIDAGTVRQALRGAATRKTRWFRADEAEVLRYVPSSEIGRCHFQKTGIAQLSELSGVCWYSAMLYALCNPPELRQHLQRHLEARRRECPHCDYLHHHLPKVLNSQAESEAVRRYLYEKMHIGDNPDQDPTLDGQNGGSCATLVCGAIRLPLVTLIAPWLKRADVVLNDAHDRPAAMPPEPAAQDRSVLVVRTYRTRWKAPETLQWGGRAYRLMSALIGSEFCGHQIAIARSCEADTWSVSDSDGIRLGILPICFRKPKGTPFHELAPRMIPYSNATSTSNFCDMSLGGRHPLKVLHDTLRSQGLAEVTHDIDSDSTAHDLINVDYVYLQEA